MNFRNQPANRARRRQRRKNNPLRTVIAAMLALTGLYIIATGNIAAGLLLILFALSITRRVQYFMTARHLGKAFRTMIPAALFAACCLVLPPVGAREEPAPAEPALTAPESSTAPESAAASWAEVHFLSTGNSDAIIIRTPDRCVMIDAADQDDEQQILAYLQDLHVTTIDYLVSTHPDADHSGSLDAVVENVTVGQVLVSNGSADTRTYQSFITALSDKGLTPSVPLEGVQIPLSQDSYLQFYNTKAQGSGNELSLITLFVHGDHRFLLMADADQALEESIMDQLPKVDVLKVSHHGSDTGTSPAFLSHINPDIAVITCGLNNDYGHPHQQTLDTLQQAGVTLYRTDTQGNIVIRSDADQLTVTTSAQNTQTAQPASAPTAEPTFKPTPAPTPTEAVLSESDQQFHQNSAPSESGSQYIGNLNSQKFHRPSCSTLPQPQNRIYFDSREAAINVGYDPCKRCNP